MTGELLPLAAGVDGRDISRKDEQRSHVLATVDLTELGEWSPTETPVVVSQWVLLPSVCSVSLVQLASAH